MARTDIENLLTADEERLYGELGRQTTMGSGASLTEQDYIGAGKRWFQTRKEQIAKAICTNAVLSALNKSGGYELVVAIAPVLAPVVGAPAAAFTVAALIVKIGFNAFCTAQGHFSEDR